MPDPNDVCPCGSGRKFKRCHGGVEAGPARRPSERHDHGHEAAFDPFGKVFREDGAIDVEYAGKRIPTLVNLLRKEPMFFEFRLDSDRLAERLTADDAKPVRDAVGDEAFEAALRDFSTAHLHELAEGDLTQRLRAALMEYSREVVHSRRDRAGAAIGAALLSGRPDATGLRGRSLLDIVLRVTLEELHALEELRRKGRETEGGIPTEALEKFWAEYPALKWHHERRYRREVSKTLHEIDAGNLPAAISADFAMRGAHILLSEVARRKAAEKVEPVEAQTILRETFGPDLLDGGREAVLARWNTALTSEVGGDAEARRQFHRTLTGAIHLVADGGPGADAVLFFAYLRAVVQGHYYVRDQAEADSARRMFTTSGLSSEGALTYAAYLTEIGDDDTLRRVALAAVELWPADEAVRAMAKAAGEREEAAAKSVRQGPTYEEHVKTDALGESGEA